MFVSNKVFEIVLSEIGVEMDFDVLVVMEFDGLVSEVDVDVIMNGDSELMDVVVIDDMFVLLVVVDMDVEVVFDEFEIDVGDLEGVDLEVVFDEVDIDKFFDNDVVVGLVVDEVDVVIEMEVEVEVDVDWVMEEEVVVEDVDDLLVDLIEVEWQVFFN